MNFKKEVIPVKIKKCLEQGKILHTTRATWFCVVFSKRIERDNRATTLNGSFAPTDLANEDFMNAWRTALLA